LLFGAPSFVTLLTPLANFKLEIGDLLLKSKLLVMRIGLSKSNLAPDLAMLLNTIRTLLNVFADWIITVVTIVFDRHSMWKMQQDSGWHPNTRYKG